MASDLLRDNNNRSMYKAAVPNPRFSAKFTLLKKSFESLGATLSSPSGDEFIWQLSVDGKTSFFLGETFPLNSASAWRLAKDKLASYQVLEAAGVLVPKGFAYFRPHKVGGSTFVESERLIGGLSEQIENTFPSSFENPSALFVVKPGEASGGAGVKVCMGSQSVLGYAEEVFRWGHYGLVQEFVPGSEWRVVILKGKILITYERQLMVLNGDGVKTIRAHLPKEHPLLADAAAFQKVMALSGSPHMTLESVLEKNQQFTLQLEAHNLSQGGKPLVVDNPPPAILECAIRAHDALGLQFSGVDLKLRPDGSAVILEVNGNPGFLIFREFYPELTDRFVKALSTELLNFVRQNGVDLPCR